MVIEFSKVGATGDLDKSYFNGSVPDIERRKEFPFFSSEP